MTDKKTHRKKSAAARVAIKQNRTTFAEADSVYFLKLVIVVLLGVTWLWLKEPISWHGVYIYGFPFGLVAGILLISRFEKIEDDRKIWYAVLVLVSILTYFVPKAGIFV